MKRSYFKQKPFSEMKPMKRTALKRGTSQLKRSGFASKSPTKKRRVKTPMAKAKIKLWTLCREITRARYGNDCYTCNTKGLEKSNWQTGHFISSSICSVELRYALDNLRIQCYSCNINKSGNWLAFEKRLRSENGENFVEELKQRNEDTKGRQYDILYYEKKILEYTDILNE